MEPDVSFVGVKLLPGKKTKVGGTINPESSIWTIHITQFALAAGAKPGKNTITITQDDGEAFALGTLEKDRCEQFQGDFMLSQEVQIVNHGKSEVHLTGYQTTTEVMDPELAIESEEEDEEDLISGSDMGRRRLAALKAMQVVGNGLPEEEDSEEDEDFDAEAEVEEEGDDMIDEDGEESDGEEDDEDDEDEAPAGIPLKAADVQRLLEAQKKGKRTLEQDADDSESSELDDEEDELLRDAALEGMEDTDDDEADDDDEELEEDDLDDSDVDVTNEDDKKEEKELLTASKILKQQKRSLDSGKATPQPNKKAKIESTPATPAASDGDKQWTKELKAYLVKNGATPISSLGSRVKKPQGVNRKLKKLLEDNKDFVLDASGNVSLAS